MNTIFPQSRLYENYIIFIYGLLLFKLTPISYLGAQWGNTIIEIVVFISLLVILGLNFNMKLIIDKISILLIALSLVFLFTESRIFWGYGLNVKETFNVILYTLLYLVISNLLFNYNLNKNRIVKQFYKLLLINIFISLIAYLSPPIFEFYNTLFETSKSTTIGSSYKRFSGTFYNPNFFGIFFAIIACSFFYYAMQKKGTNILYFLGAMASVYLVNISGSRSALLTLFILLIVVLFSLNYKIVFLKLKQLSIVYTIILFTATPLLIYQFFVRQNSLSKYMYPDFNLNSRFLNKESILENYYGRLDMARNASYLFSESPIFGIGSSIESVDNQYAKILMETGLSGLTILAILLIAILYIQVKNFKFNDNIENKLIVLASILFTVAYLFNMFGAAVFSVTQLSSLYFLILGISNSYQEIENTKITNIA